MGTFASFLNYYGYNESNSVYWPQCQGDQVVIFSLERGNLTCKGKECAFSDDEIAQKLHHTIEAVRSFFLSKFNVCGIDGRGKLPPFFIGWDEQNARWECKGDNCLWRFADPYAVMPEVVGHEYTHAIVKHFGQLQPGGQSGALNESISDIFGVAFNQWQGGAQNDWKIGNFRDLSSHIDMRSFQEKSAAEDNVHTNSRIPSHAFYCAVKSISNVSWGVMATVWWIALNKVRPNATFYDFAIATLWASNENLTVFQAVKEAWVHVGVLQKIKAKTMH